MTDLKITRPISGEVYVDSTSRKVEQYGPDEFLEYIDSLLDLDHVTGVRFTAFTPHFNDGDACVYGTNEPRLLLSPELSAVFAEFDQDYFEYGDGTYTHYDFQRYDTPEAEQHVFGTFNAKYLYDALSDAYSSLTHFLDVIQANFGDHVEVTATKEGFDVEFYDHD